MGKFLFTLVMWLLVGMGLAANTYVVSANSSLNIRESATSNSAIIGKLHPQEQVNVSAIEGEWAKITWNGQEAYVNARYITQVTVKKSETKVGNLWDWFFHSEGDSGLLKVFKWILAIVIVFIIIGIGYICLAFVFSTIGGGLSLGGIAFMGCFILKLLGIMSWDTLWVVTKWGFYLGCCVGFLIAIFNPRQALKIMESNGSSQPSRTGMSPQVGRYHGVRAHKCCGSCAYCTEGLTCNNTSCGSYLNSVDIDNDGQYCKWYVCRY